MTDWFEKSVSTWLVRLLLAYWDAQNYDWDGQVCTWDAVSDDAWQTSNNGAWYTKN